MYRKSISLFLMLLISSCAVGPNYREPALDLPENFVEVRAVDPQSDNPAWWRCFGDQELGALIDKAIKDNKSVKEALARVNESRSLRREAFLNLFPGGAVGAEYTRFRNSTQGRFSGFGGEGAGQQEFASVSADASWELDIFGGLRRELEGRRAEQTQVEFELADVVRIVIADIVANYIELRGAQARLSVAQNNARTQESTAGVTATMAREGASSEFEAARSRAQLKSTEAEIPLLDAEAKVAVNALSVLTAQPIAELREKLITPVPLKSCDLPKELGVPAELLRRRPDLRVAERRLAAATARIGVAVAEFFPKFTLSGNISYEAVTFSDLDHGDEGYTFGPSVSWPILTFGRIRRRVDRADARMEQALQAYEGAVLNAVREAEDGLVRFKADQEQVRHLRDAARASRQATELARTRYELGDIDLLGILDVQRVQLESERALALAERNLALAAVDLYKALGGGWEYAQIAN